MATDWSESATSDLRMMHDLIRDNHPGPVNAEDPAFHIWLETGAEALRVQAQAARTQHDYRMVLLTYANGFADGHLEVLFNGSDNHLWPGFLTRVDTPGDPARVVLTEAAPGISIGDVLLGCGNETASDLLTTRVLRPCFNPSVPQRLRLISPWQTVVSADDIAGQAATCQIATGTGVRTAELHWRPIDQGALSHRLARASGISIPKLGLRNFDETWMISLPTFMCRGPGAVRMQALIASLRAHAPQLHKARRVILDLRGNAGGDSQWGEDVAEALWGGAIIKAVKSSFDATVDWRVSPGNRDALLANAAIMRQAGHAGPSARSYDRARRMDEALKAKAALMRDDDPPDGPPPSVTSPFNHPVYVLTDPNCASACLDFLDILDRLPGITRVGLPTNADTNYLDSAVAPLPSGIAKLAYPMKVYRNRARGAGVAYQPEYTWPGGTMTTKSVVSWINGLP